jgi:hypothetical protein
VPVARLPFGYGPRTTIYNRFNRWSRRRIWQRILQALVEAGWIEATASIDATYVKAHRSAHGGKGGRASAPPPAGPATPPGVRAPDESKLGTRKKGTPEDRP